jgi:hypothetical protein
MAELWGCDKKAAGTFRTLISTWVEKIDRGAMLTDCSSASNEVTLSREFAELSLQNDPAPLSKMLHAHLKKSAFGGNRYVPRDMLAKRLTSSRVAEELHRHGLDSASLVSFILEHAVTVFAILVLADLIPGARDLEKHGITDACLPLTERDEQIRQVQKPPAEQDVSGWFDTEPMKHGASVFIHHQWRLFTPVFCPERGVLQLSRDAVLPFTEYDKPGYFHGAFDSVHKACLERANQTAFPKVGAHYVFATILV